MYAKGLTFVAPLAVFAMVFAGCRSQKLAATPPLPVQVATAATSDVPLYVDTFGKCVTVASVTVIPQVTGILSETLFEEGAEVKAGQEIFQIDARPYQAAVQQAQGNLATAQGNLVNAQQKIARQQKLYSTRVSDVQELQDAQAALTAAQGDVTACQGALDTAQINLGYCTLRSPIDGKTGHYLINTGNLVTANSSQLVNIQTLSPIYVDYTVSEADLGHLRKWLDKDGLDVEVSLPGDTKPVDQGKLYFIDNQIAGGTGTLMLRATVPNQAQRLWPGQFVNVRLILTTLKNAVVVPSDAVLIGQTGSYVFVLQADDTVAVRPVTSGQREGDRTVIETGLKAGEKVVTSGQIALAPGEKVAPQESAPAPAVAAKP